MCIHKYNKTKDAYNCECNMEKCKYYQINTGKVNSCKLNKAVIELA